ncbi:NAD(P)-binding protein [Conidiobolus coronatus NRRL 28638]|uniref:NAD(P)-binding protein n=1 Tax=Conidiobolus coronatus (strain ATCC 28846 / CBS 209.66 / NRRL 28638) TaxID=796925 RepID=A0A137P4C8_CONC2|nr:NAD(P)-binding protein [Conidiobolus coronatus NRRL 28638]|eukprot:KXN69878.1 NAD(P)-binding protein [Conidiobolus coronatus NRRL 28638]
MNMIMNQLKTLNIPKVDLTGKVAIVTGGSQGVGFGTSLILAKLNCRVIVASRSAEKCEKAVSEIKTKTGNENVDFITLDLGSFKSVREFADQVLQKEKAIDFLILNAGAVYHSYEKTDDDIEKNLQINHLSHLLLALLLIPIIPKSKESRLVFVSSRLHLSGKLTVPDTLHLAPENFSKFQRYNDTKLMNVLTVKELSRKLYNTGIIVAAVNPGLVKSNLSQANSSDDFSGKVEKCLVTAFSNLLGRDEEQGAMTSVYAAISDDTATGGYYDSCEPSKYNPLADDVKLCAELYSESLKVIGFDDKGIFV